jgi:WD40 repeat protein
MAASPDGAWLAVGEATGGGINIINLKTQQVVRRLQHHSNTISALAWSHDGEYLASGTYNTLNWSNNDNDILLWQAKDWKKSSNYSFNGSGVEQVYFLPNTELCIARHRLCKLVVWPVNNHSSGSMARLFGVLPSSEPRVLLVEECISAFAVSLDGRFIAAAGFDTVHYPTVMVSGIENTNELANIYLERPIKRIEQTRDSAYGSADWLQWSVDNRHVIIGDTTHIIIWPWQDEQAPLRLEHQHQKLVGLVYHSENGYFTTAGEDGAVRVWSIDSLTPLYTLDIADETITVIASLPAVGENMTISIACASGNVYCWQPQAV